MDKTESIVRIALTAIEAPLYDVGVLSERGMLPRLDGISAAAVLDRLSLLKYRNAHGSHIYIRPSGEHRFTTLDDLNETSLARLSADGFNPCAVVKTSAGNFQAWLMHSRVFPKLFGIFAGAVRPAVHDTAENRCVFQLSRGARRPSIQPNGGKRIVLSICSHNKSPEGFRPVPKRAKANFVKFR
ncbi:MAG TPA: DNA-primase RepB domain-containing protein, partial [Edaphobacter sp.]|nr:DNA-primase RepB domain-containing protein [Edaphobacter sp.]